MDPKQARGWARVVKTWARVVPFAGWMLVFLGIPAAAVAVGAFEKSSGSGFTMANVNMATTGVYLRGFETSLKMALVTSIVPGVAGTFLAYAVHTSRGSVLRRAIVTASGVFANFGGIPLAFLFIASIGGETALVTNWLRDIGFNLYGSGFTLYTFSGVALVYMYFQVPLMVLVTLPAFEGLRASWHEAAENLGAHSWQYWRYVGIPVLLPSLLGSTLLLFGSALSAYATADALTAGTLALTPLQIGTFMNGDVAAGEQNVGKALALGLVLIVAVVMIFYVLVQRRASRWLR
jgi:putative spermidine/putrescine transport system permease protein